jgi:four helix bundle protein
MRNYKDLKIWVRSVKLASLIYKLTSRFPSEEKFGIISQLRRASISISSNIAEGSARSSEKDFSRFINIAYGSLCEVETQLVIAHDLKFIPTPEHESILLELNELQKMIFTFSKTLNKAQNS